MGTMKRNIVKDQRHWKDNFLYRMLNKARNIRLARSRYPEIFRDLFCKFCSASNNPVRYMNPIRFVKWKNNSKFSKINSKKSKFHPKQQYSKVYDWFMTMSGLTITHLIIPPTIDVERISWPYEDICGNNIRKPKTNCHSELALIFI